MLSPIRRAAAPGSRRRAVAGRGRPWSSSSPARAATTTAAVRRARPLTPTGRRSTTVRRRRRRPSTVAPGVEMVTVTGAEPGHDLTLVDDEGQKLLTLTTDDVGQAHFAYVPESYLTYQTGEGGSLPTGAGDELEPGTYTIRDESADPVAVSDDVRGAGTRRPPRRVALRRPGGRRRLRLRHHARRRAAQHQRAAARARSRTARTPPSSSTPATGRPTPTPAEPGSLIAGPLGYATVGVNMRGTGCSGGVFDVFNPAQQADGYDVVETIARQPWVLHNEVGMVGLSYSGITQLYVASTQPPSLAAITPALGHRRLVADGLARGHVQQRLHRAVAGRAQPAVRGRRHGLGAPTRIDAGDEHLRGATRCIRSQNPDFGDVHPGAREPPGRRRQPRPRSARAGHRGARLPDRGLAGRADRAAASPTMLDDFTSTDQERFMLFNGRHPDGYTPLVLTRWFEFLELYVRRAGARGSTRRSGARRHRACSSRPSASPG